MEDKKPTYIAGLGWRYDVEHSMLRRMQGHDYSGRCIYMLTLTTEGRRALLGTLRYEAGKPETALIEPTPLGVEVINCWAEIPRHYPEVKLLAFQLMPDHVHGLLFVTQKQAAHLGQMVNGFKVGCNRAYRRLGLGDGAVKYPEAVPQETQPAAPLGAGGAAPLEAGEAAPQWAGGAMPRPTGPGPDLDPARPKHPKKGLLFSTGYQDSILMGAGQLERMFAYISDNPRRLAVKRENPALFRIVRQVAVGGTLNGTSAGTSAGTPAGTPAASGTSAGTPAGSGTPAGTPSASGTSAGTPAVSGTSAGTPAGNGTPAGTPAGNGTPAGTPAGTPSPAASEGAVICDAIGNHWLLERHVRMQVRCHNNQTPENLRLIARQKEYFLARGAAGGVVVSPCISAGEKEIARACLDAGVPLIVILENGFPPMYKPPGKYFEACAKGLLLMLAPWPYHTDRRTITRRQCLALNDIAGRISTEPWTSELERGFWDFQL